MKNRTDSLFAFTGILALLASASPVLGATRTVQFTGIAQSKTHTAAVNNQNVRMYCTIAVVNTGVSSQKVTSIQFASYNARTGGTDYSASGVSYIIGTSASGSSTTGTTSDCTTGTIAKGGMCVIKAKLDTVSWNTRLGVCAGKITVQDAATNQPGSVVAAGSITTVQEAMVSGGVLSAALYDTGPPIIQDEYDTGGVAVNYGSYIGQTTSVAQMNYNCAKACVSKRANDGKSGGAPKCSKHCGASVMDSTAVFNRKRCYLSAAGNCAELDGTNQFIPYNEERLRPTVGFLENVEPTVAETATPTDPPNENIGFTNGYIVNIRKPNSYYAGGMVHELSIGPYRSICSANKSFPREGGTSLEHDDAYENTVWVGSSGNPTREWEMLYCAHRHRQTDLFERLGATSPFVINSGMPF